MMVAVRVALLVSLAFVVAQQTVVRAEGYGIHESSSSYGIR